jgi:excisionase family DNA binding protein
MSIPTEVPRWLTVPQAAVYLNVTPQTIRAAMHRGELRATQLRERSPYLLDRLDIDRYLERRKRALPPYRRGSKPWVSKRHAEARVA